MLKLSASDMTLWGAAKHSNNLNFAAQQLLHLPLSQSGICTCIMCGCECEGRLICKLPQNCNCQRRAFHRICSTTKLVQKHQTVAACLPKNARDLLQMSRKSGEALLQRLAITKVCQYIFKHRYLHWPW
jgi:hypothetical protein